MVKNFISNFLTETNATKEMYKTTNNCKKEINYY